MVETTRDIPAMPQIWVKIREMTQHLNISAAAIANEILKDQGMTSRILKAANSATYAGYNQRITTVTNAIVLLGFNEVRNIVVGLAVYNMLEKLKHNKRFKFKEFWMHSLATAVAARMIAELVQYKNTEEAFVAGLLHDVGKLVISQLMPKQYDEVLLLTENGESDIVAEDNIFHVDHQVIGQWLAERWHLPEVLVYACSMHHRLELDNRQKSRFRIVDIVSVANDMAHLIFCSNKNERKQDAQKCQNKALSLLTISKDNWSRIIRNLADNVRKEIEEYNLSETDFENLLTTFDDDELEEYQTEKLYQEMNHELNERVRELSTLNDFSSALLEVENQDQIQNLLLESIYRGIAFNRVLLFSPDKKGDLVAVAGFGAEVNKLIGTAKLDKKKGGVIVQSFTEKKATNVLNAASHLFADMVSQQELNILRCASFACVPLAANDRSLGIIVVDNHISSDPVQDQRLSTVVTFCNQASLVLKRLI
ncbi:MAG: HDOD domain-containing protein [Calditrichaeota bacterium]|nr:MAG: HDOD domain-containing protein [Calditrichota bacterium]